MPGDLRIRKRNCIWGEEGLVGWHDQVGKGKVQAIRNNGMVQNSGAISDTTKPNLILLEAGKIPFAK